MMTTMENLKRSIDRHTKPAEEGGPFSRNKERPIVETIVGKQESTPAIEVQSNSKS
jgi:hypothetical protein